MTNTGSDPNNLNRFSRFIYTPMRFTPNFCYWNDKDFDNVKDKTKLLCISVCTVENNFLREGEEVDIIFEDPWS